LIIYRFDASLLFFNADYFNHRVRAVIAEATTKPKWILLDAESIPILDVTGADTLEALRAELAGQDIILAIARAKGLFRVMLDRAGVAERIGREHIFPTVHAGAQAFLAEQSGKFERLAWEDKP
jgi:MFS superfamily sulfate permease-like transporter